MLQIQWDLHKISVSPITQFLKCISSVRESNKVSVEHSDSQSKKTFSTVSFTAKHGSVKICPFHFQLVYIHSKVTGTGLPKDKVLHIWPLEKMNKITLEKPAKFFYLLTRITRVFILAGSGGSLLSHNSLFCQQAWRKHGFISINSASLFTCRY